MTEDAYGELREQIQRIVVRMSRLAVALLLVIGSALSVTAAEIRPGVSAALRVQDLPLPIQGYDVYLAGEMHGIVETEEFLMQYLRQLHSSSGLRDVAIEEHGVYESEAQAFVDGRSDSLPLKLCLRAGFLGAIRRFNISLSKNEQIRIHLIDIDSPASAIHQHLAIIKERVAANDVSIPGEAAIKEHGIETAAQLKRLTTNSATLSELRTIELSVRAYQQGLEIDLGPPKGSPYLDSREDAVASNIVDLIRIRKIPSLLVLYGDDHVSRTNRKDGGPHRDQPFTPMALRLRQSGIKVFSVATLPLSGTYFWRGRGGSLLWTATDARLASGETMAHVLSTAPEAPFIYVDPRREQGGLPTYDYSHMEVDAFLLFRSGSPMKNYCRTQ